MYAVIPCFLHNTILLKLSLNIWPNLMHKHYYFATHEMYKVSSQENAEYLQII